ncbi:8260_t:CDS:1 [Paraglomus brasilianum]|uniref:8260_t:CDS:1 n=1 Tax=Paraglomus brasilianum TaxID=144538 RepID=A0A9N8W2J6_9GLOM|nr:8260_t:CDS:1 [Paraglomus brasilianum]
MEIKSYIIKTLQKLQAKVNNTSPYCNIKEIAPAVLTKYIDGWNYIASFGPGPNGPNYEDDAHFSARLRCRRSRYIDVITSPALGQTGLPTVYALSWPAKAGTTRVAKSEHTSYF